MRTTPGTDSLAHLWPLALTTLLAAALPGCSPHSGVLARVGDTTIDVDDFLDAARVAVDRYPGGPEEAKAMLLEDLVRRALLVEAAERRGVVGDSLLRLYRRNLEEEVLGSALTGRMIPGPVQVSDAEVRQLYEWRKTQAHVHVVYAANRRMAEAASAELRRGRGFAEVADRFNLRGIVPAGGDMGFLSPGSLVNPIDELIRQAPLNQAIGPVEAPGEGWFIVKVSERRARQQEPFGLQRLSLAEMLRQRKQRALSTRAARELRDDYGLAVEPGAAQLLFARYNSPPTGAEASARPEPPAPTREQRGTVLARYHGGPDDPGIYTLADALDDLASGIGERPDPTMTLALEQWIESRALHRIMVVEARRRHIDQEPEIARRIEQGVGNYLLDAIYRTEVAERVEVEQEDVLAAYQRRISSFERLDWVRVQHLTLPDSLSAERVIAHASGATTLSDAILLGSPGMEVREELVRYPSEDPVWGPLKPRFMSLAPGAYARPLRVEGGWRVIQLITKQQVVEPLESLAPEIQQDLHSEAMIIARERVLTQVCDSLRSRIPTEVHGERLKRVRWPVRENGAGPG